MPNRLQSCLLNIKISVIFDATHMPRLDFMDSNKQRIKLYSITFSIIYIGLRNLQWVPPKKKKNEEACSAYHYKILAFVGS